MKRFNELFLKKFTLGFLLTLFATLVYAIVLRLLIIHFFDVYPIKGGLTIADLSYFLSIATWKFIFSILLELILGEKFSMSMSLENFIDNSNRTTLNMDKGKAPQPSNSSSQTGNSSSENKSWTFTDSDNLLDSMLNNLTRQKEMIGKLSELKESKDLKYYVEHGAFDVEVPLNMPDDEAKKLVKQLSIIDAVYNTKYSEYKDMEKKDTLFNKGTWKKSMSEEKNSYRKDYKDLFEK